MNLFSSSEPTLTAAGAKDERFQRVCADLKLTVDLDSVDTFKDVDDKEFTMYSIQVNSAAEGGRAGVLEWLLQRRYSQFHELKTRMESMPGYEDAVKSTKFPGKVFFNKTSEKVVNERKSALMEWLNALLKSVLATHYHVNSFLEAVDDNVVAAGEALPAATWKDVSDAPLNLGELPTDQIIIIAAASYWTYQALTAFLDPCVEKAMKRYPDLRQLNVGISELRLVPPAVRGQVRPILSMLIKNAQKKLDEKSELCGVPKGNNMLRFIFDFDGAYLRDLRVHDCDWTWRVWLVYDGAVLASLRSSTPDAAEVFAKQVEMVAALHRLEPR